MMTVSYPSRVPTAPDPGTCGDRTLAWWDEALNHFSARVVVIGQGFVGLAIAMSLAEAGFPVIGIDPDVSRLDRIRELRTEAAPERLARLLKTGGLRQTSQIQCLTDADVILICVPTPLTLGIPDHSYVLQAAADIHKHGRQDVLVVLESTVSPGFVEEHLVPLLGARLVAFSPERVDPTHPELRIGRAPRLVSGTTAPALELARRLYERAEIQTFPTKVRVAEYAKLLENCQRLVNIALIDEVAGLCRKEGVSIDDVLEAAATKPYGYTAYHTGPGAGGHCVPVDPAFLAQRGRQKGHALPLVEQALVSNRGRIEEVVQVTRALGSGDPPTVLLVGVSYKPGVADTRESAAEYIRASLMQSGWRVLFHDNLVGTWHNQPSTPMVSEALEDSTVVVLLSPQGDVDFESLGRFVGPIVDTRGLTGIPSARVVRV